MAMECIKCPVCGNTQMFKAVQLAQGEYWHCECCCATLAERLARKEYENIVSGIESGLKNMGIEVTEALVKEKLELFENRRASLVSAVKADYVNSAEVVRLCNLILDIRPADFLAEFFKVANSGTRREVAEYISGIDEETNAAYMELVIDFITRSLEYEYIDPISALLERCSKIFSIEKKMEYRTKFETEAAMVKDGIYEIGISRDVFIAYSSKDIKAVEKLVEFIESEEIGLTCFAAYRNLQHGRDAVANYERALKEAMDNCSIFLFVSSVNSRNFNCDAFKIEMAYIRNSDMKKCPDCRNYAVLPEKYRKLRIEYRLDHKKTPLADRNMKDFFAGLTYVEDYDQLVERLVYCMNKLSEEYEENDEGAEREARLKAELEAQRRADEIERLKAELEAKTKAEEEAKRNAEAEAKRRVEEEAKRQAEAEAKRKAEEEAKRNAEAEAKRKAEEEAKRNAELEAKRKADEEAKRQAEAEAKRRAEEEAKRNAEVEAKRKAEEEEKQNSAQYETNIQNAKEQGFEIVDGVLKKYTGTDKKVVIPYGVTTIGRYAFNKCTDLISVTIPMSVTAIQSCAFSKCSNLTNIIIPKSVISIGNNAFEWCSSLTHVSIPDGVKSIGIGLFYMCSKLSDITIPDNVTSIGRIAFSHCNSLTNITIPKAVTAIERYAFASCSNLTIYVHSNTDISKWEKSWNDISSVYELGTNRCLISNDSENLKPEEAAKKNLKLEAKRKAKEIAQSNPEIDAKLKEAEEQGFVIMDGVLVTYKGSKVNVIIPDIVTCIGSNAFADRASVKKVVVPSSVILIEANAFFWHYNLTSITIPNSVVMIEKTAFSLCDNLTIYVQQGTDVSKWDKGWNGSSSVYELDTNRCLILGAIEQKRRDDEEAKRNSAQYETNIQNAKEQGFEIVDGVLVKYNGSATEVIIPDVVTSIGEKAFCENHNIQKVVIPNGVTTIGAMAFKNCNSLARITIPDSVKVIKTGALVNCSNLTEVTIPKGVTTIEPWTFSACSSLHNVIIPKSVTTIGMVAFKDCSNLTKVTIPNSVTTIGIGAFSFCSNLTEITIPNSVGRMGERVFDSCDNLTIYVPEGTDIFKWGDNWSGDASVYELGSNRCLKLGERDHKRHVEEEQRKVEAAKQKAASKSKPKVANYPTKYPSLKAQGFEINGSVLTKYTGTAKEVIIPDTVKNIDTSAFYDCRNITKITIPNSVIAIGAMAFKNCTSLREINIPHSVRRIDYCAFENCAVLHEVTIPKSVEYINFCVFEKCKDLTVRIHKDANVLRWDSGWNKLRFGLISKKVKTVTYS